MFRVDLDVINYLLETYATNDINAEKDAAASRHSPLTAMVQTNSVESLSNK